MFSAAVATQDFRATLDDIVGQGFNCYTDIIDVGATPLAIQIGDVIGACVFNPIGVSFHQLNVVGRMNGESLLEADLPPSSCNINSIPSTVSEDDLDNRNDRRLHIYANIQPGKKYGCTHKSIM